MDYKGSIFTNSEQLVIVISEFHSLDWLAVSLNLSQSVQLQGVLGLVLSNLVDDDATWFIWISDTSKESLCIMSNG